MDIGNSFQQASDRFFSFLPNVLGALVILLVGYIVARVVATVVGKVLDKLGLDRRLKESQASKYVDNILPGASPAAGIARVVFWFIFIFFLFSAIGALQIPALTAFMNQVLGYLPNVVAAILIFVVAALIAGAVGGGVTRVMGETPTGKVVAAVVPALVMVIALFMILTQLRIAPSIVQIAFAATMGAIALALALAFGLGGRSVAERMLEDAYRKGQEAKDQVRRDAQVGKENAEQEAQRARSRVEGAEGSQGSGLTEEDTSTRAYPTGTAQDSAQPGAAGDWQPGAAGDVRRSDGSTPGY